MKISNDASLERRLKKICNESIELLNLDLSGLTIVTEAASGLFITTPLIALMAGAKEVVCLTKDTVYGQVSEIKSELLELSHRWGLSNPTIITDRSSPVLKNADVITNLGMVRPLDRSLLNHIGHQVVIPYMCEGWEIRPGDLDFAFCQEVDIPVMGTNEDAPEMMIFSQCGMLALKMTLEIGLEVAGNKIAILSSDHFGKVIHKTLSNVGAHCKLFTSTNHYEGLEKGKWDAVIVAEYCRGDVIIGNDGIISGTRFNELIENTYAIIQLLGVNEVEKIKKLMCKVYPEKTLVPHKMSRTLADLGPRPLILLHAAGLKVGEAMARARQKGLSGGKFYQEVLGKSPSQLIEYIV
ncbi:hypothetical protein [Paenibacillus tyrfis]|uniref:Uncharacterized protein n=1 Tax=Paenibacillus tyrfis TaxID=1501230 RepID=A0A081P3L0_9BACL|nr:hypothetical protein [Paenibacillus tyrfis]KEQ25283.1 hypothetical protein ET33_04295 [Paenibacillus tyrfis]